MPELDVSNIMEGGAYLVVLWAVVWAVRRVFEKDGFLDGLRDLHKSLGESAKQQSVSVASLDAHAAAHTAAGKEYCKFLRADIKTRDIPDESKEELIAYIDRIEQGLTK